MLHLHGTKSRLAGSFSHPPFFRPPGWHPAPVGDTFCVNHMSTVAITRWAGARVLLVDDDAVNRILASHVIASVTGLLPDTAWDGDEGCAMARQTVYDLVLMDLHMPGLDGVQAALLIRHSPGPAGRVPIVALTASLRVDDIARCQAAGMNGHLIKPLAAADLQALRRAGTDSACSG